MENKKKSLNRKQILEKLKRIIGEVLDIDDITLGENMTAKDIDGWDSLTHISIISSIEEDFGIEFTVNEVLNFNTIKDMIDTIEIKI